MKTAARKALTGVFCAVAACLALDAIVIADSIGYRKSVVLGVPAHIITADLRDPAVYVTIGLPSAGVGKAENFRSMLRRSQPDAAITGTYFCTRSLKPVGDLVVSGSIVNEGSVGTALAIDGTNIARCVPLRIGRDTHWESFETVLCAGPRLVSNGVTCVNPRKEGFQDPALFRRHIRPAVGLTAEGKLLLVSASKPVTFSELAKILRRIGAVDAVGLDGGSSTALYYRGKVLLSPKRSLTNLLLVYTDQQMRAQMAKERACQRELLEIEQAFNILRNYGTADSPESAISRISPECGTTDVAGTLNGASLNPLNIPEHTAALPDMPRITEPSRWISVSTEYPQMAKLSAYFANTRPNPAPRSSLYQF